MHATEAVSLAQKLRNRFQAYPKYIHVPVTIYITYLLVVVTSAGTVQDSNFNRQRKNSSLNTSETEYLVKSLMDCAQFCSSLSTCCGFKFFKTGVPVARHCTRLIEYDINNGVLTSALNTDIYIKDDFVKMFEDAQAAQIQVRNVYCRSRNVEKRMPPPPPHTHPADLSVGCTCVPNKDISAGASAQVITVFVAG